MKVDIQVISWNAASREATLVVTVAAGPDNLIEWQGVTDHLEEGYEPVAVNITENENELHWQGKMRVPLRPVG